MATGTFKATVLDVDNTQKRVIVFGTIAISAGTDTYLTGGLNLTLSDERIKSTAINPDWMNIVPNPAVGVSPSGWQYYYTDSQTLGTPGKIVVMNGTTQFTTAGALTPLANDACTFVAYFPRI